MSCNICKKYNIAEPDFRAMVKDGRISVTVLRHDEIYSTYLSNLSNSSGVQDAVLKTSISERVEERTIYRIIAEFR